MQTDEWSEELRPLDADTIHELETDDLKPLAGFEHADEYDAGVYGMAVNLDAAVRVFHPADVSTVDATAATSMANAIRTLPAATEAVHMWIGAQHSMGHVLPAILQLAAPAMIEQVHIATLTFSKTNAEEWAGMIDARQVTAMSIVVSQYFEKTSPHLFDPAAALLRPRGVRLSTSRCHAKLLCVRLSDGRTITAEGSANTRSAKTLENVTLFGSPQVYQFHRQQLDRIAGLHAARIERQKNEDETKGNESDHADEGQTISTETTHG